MVSMNWDASEFKGPVTELSYGDDFFEKETTLSLSKKKPFLGLFFNLENAFDYSFPCNKLPSGTMRKNHYTFMYVPKECCRYHLKKGNTTTFSLDFSPEFLKSFSVQFPILEDLLTSVERKIPYTLSPQPLIATEEMLAGISAIIYSSNTKDTRDAFIYTKVFDVLLLCLKQITVIKIPKNTFNEKILEARGYILEHLQQSLSLSLLASKIKVDPRTLTRNFKKIYKITVMGFIFEERMKNAGAMLRDSNKNITQIALLSGYKSVSNFSEAFTRRYGYSPSALRKRNSER
jgi:AraC-like DNA-binding protein